MTQARGGVAARRTDLVPILPFRHRARAAPAELRHPEVRIGKLPVVLRAGRPQCPASPRHEDHGGEENATHERTPDVDHWQNHPQRISQQERRSSAHVAGAVTTSYLGARSTFSSPASLKSFFLT